MNGRLWIIFVVLVIAGLGGLILWKKGETPEVNIDAYDIQKLLTIDDVGQGQIPDHFVGKKDAQVVVIEYEDFACVHCAQLSSTFDKIMTDYKDRVLFIYRNFSLNYPNSTVSQSAGEAAYLLGGEEKFWEMHGLLFQDDSTWTGQAVPSETRKNLLRGYAESAGLDADKFLAAIEEYRGNGISIKMNRDREMGQKAGVSGTPAWFVNGKKVDKVDDSSLRTALDDALAAAGEQTGAAEAGDATNQD